MYTIQANTPDKSELIDLQKEREWKSETESESVCVHERWIYIIVPFVSIIYSQLYESFDFEFCSSPPIPILTRSAPNKKLEEKK